MENEIVFSDRLLQQIRQAQHVVALTGAGISAESGVPTFRDAQTGLWERFRPEELASPEAFRRDPRLVWEWYAWRRELVSKASPNAGHLALVELEKRLPVFTLITQNVDGLHQRAGSGVRFPVIELHGNIQRTKCFVDGQIVNTWEEDGELPRVAHAAQACCARMWSGLASCSRLKRSALLSPLPLAVTCFYPSAPPDWSNRLPRSHTVRWQRTFRWLRSTPIPPLSPPGDLCHTRSRRGSTPGWSRRFGIADSF